MIIGGILRQLQEDSERSLAERAVRMKPQGPPPSLDHTTQSIHFLRGVQSRAGMTISAFYFFLGAQYANADTSTADDYSLRVAAAYTEFSALNSISLNCRKIFDHKPAGLTGAAFAKFGSDVRKAHAEYWSEKSGHRLDEVRSALVLLQVLFANGARQIGSLLGQESPLQQRVGLLKKHANNAAAHLSLRDYEIDLTDLAHVAAALCVIGEIIRRFDWPHAPDTYFDEVEFGSYAAAERLFPMLSAPRLFQTNSIASHASYCLQVPVDEAVEYVERKLPASIGWV